MLRRHQKLRMQLHQLMDVAVFGIAFWLAYFVRSNLPLSGTLFGIPVGRPEIEPFSENLWLYFVIIPLVLVILPIHGHYNRATFCSWRETVWSLLKSCTLITVGLILAVFLFKEA